MAIVVELPRLSDTMEEGVIAKWHVKVGDKVRRGQLIADIETDKATMEFESFDAGVVLALVAPEGETLPLGAPIAVLGAEGEDPAAALAARGGASASAAAAAAPAPSAPATPTAPPAPAPVAVPAPAPPAPAPAAPAAARAGDGRVPASPLARQLARAAGLDLAAIPGSGPHGRVVKADVERAAAAGPAAAAAPAASAPPVADETHKQSLLGKTIAKRLAGSWQSMPHFFLTTIVDMTEAAALRGKLNEVVSETKISFNDLVIAATARALRLHPNINARFNDDFSVTVFGAVHIGVAVAIDEGLVVPVVRHADRTGIADISRQVRALGKRAKERKLSPDEMTGSTFTISNLGMFDIDEFTAVIQPGEGAILAVGALTDEPVVHEGQIVVRKRMKLTLSSDHRVINGADGAVFLKSLKGLLEQPLRLLVS